MGCTGEWQIFYVERVLFILLEWSGYEKEIILYSIFHLV